MIYWNGCSFVQGMEIDRVQDQFAWIVSNHFGQDMLRHSKVGGSNDRIFRNMIDDFMHPQGITANDQVWGKETADPVKIVAARPKMVIIVWSNINRFEYLNRANNTWRQAAWTRHRMAMDDFTVSDDSEMHYHPDMNRLQWEGVNNYGRSVRNAPSNLIETLNYMLAVKNMLELQKVPYLFYNMSDGQIKPVWRTLNEQKKEGANITWKQQTLNGKHYKELLPHMKEEAFYDMCIRKKVPFGPRDHPLHEGNRLMADRIIKDIYDKKMDKVFN